MAAVTSTSPSSHLTLLQSSSTHSLDPVSTRCNLGRISTTVTCLSSAVAAPTKPASSSGLLQCPVRAPTRTKPQGDWNSRMLFSRGIDSVKSVDKDTLWDAVEAAGDKPVVLDLYSKWCGPCRVMYPKFVELSDQYSDVVFLKLDCTSENKTAFSKLGIGILPTFKIFKNSNLVSEVKGAKYDELVSKIEKARTI